MTFKTPLFYFLMLLPLYPWAADKNVRTSADNCISYYTVGMSGCVGKQPSKTEDLPAETNDLLPPNQVVSLPASESVSISGQVSGTEESLENRINEFLQDYNKPPREFVAFQLEPTLDNAIKWVQKYNETLERNKRIATAWSQAEKILNTLNQRGVVVPGINDFASETALPDFSAEQKAIQEALQGYAVVDPLTGKPQKTGAVQAQTAAMTQNIRIGTGEGETSPPVDGSAFGGALSTAANNPLKTGNIAGATDVIRISYYFSAQCGFCKRFEPELKNIMAEFGARLAVSCVDMTPGERKPQNVHEGLQCQWRPATAQEVAGFGIKATPTLIIDRGKGGPFERLAGYTTADNLRKVLLAPPPQKKE